MIGDNGCAISIDENRIIFRRYFQMGGGIISSKGNSRWSTMTSQETGSRKRQDPVRNMYPYGSFPALIFIWAGV